MEKQYSQIIAPFKRVTDTPIEADYLFASVDELYKWANSNKAVLHAGLHKCVAGKTAEGKSYISIYTFVPTDNKAEGDLIIEVGLKAFILKELISSLSLDNIFWMLDNDAISLENIRDEIKAIWGTSQVEELDEKLNSIKELIDAIKLIRQSIRNITNRMAEMCKADEALAGAHDSDIVKYLEGLRYNSITAINNKLVEFFDEVNPDDPDINNWKELMTFLSGFSDQKPLKVILDEISGMAVEYKESDSIKFYPDELKTGLRLSADVKVSQNTGNQISVQKDGLYHSVDIDMNGNLLQFKVNGNIVKIINLADYAMSIEDIIYDKENECIVITFKTPNGNKIVRIPVSQIIREWEVANTDNEPVKLDLESNVGSGKDQLKAFLALDSDPDNIVQKTSKGLAVIGRAHLIKYNNSTVHAELDKLNKAIDGMDADSLLVELKKYVDEQIAKSKDEILLIVNEKEESLEAKIESISNKFDSLKQTVEERIDNMNTVINEMKQDIEDIKEMNINQHVDIENMKKQIEKLIESSTADNETLTKHIQDKNNPHETTAEQVDTYTKNDIDNMHSWNEDF